VKAMDRVCRKSRPVTDPSDGALKSRPGRWSIKEQTRAGEVRTEDQGADWSRGLIRRPPQGVNEPICHSQAGNQRRQITSFCIYILRGLRGKG
jgi:hypothetical protein